jgi:hypothetical protein
MGVPIGDGVLLLAGIALASNGVFAGDTRDEFIHAIVNALN